jgi:hypothetical protein
MVGYCLPSPLYLLSKTYDAMAHQNVTLMIMGCYVESGWACYLLCMTCAATQLCRWLILHAMSLTAIVLCSLAVYDHYHELFEQLMCQHGFCQAAASG